MTSRIRWCAVVLLAGLLPLAAPSVSAQQIQLGVGGDDRHQLRAAAGPAADGGVRRGRRAQERLGQRQLQHRFLDLYRRRARRSAGIRSGGGSHPGDRRGCRLAAGLGSQRHHQQAGWPGCGHLPFRCQRRAGATRLDHHRRGSAGRVRRCASGALPRRRARRRPRLGDRPLHRRFRDLRGCGARGGDHAGGGRTGAAATGGAPGTVRGEHPAQGSLPATSPPLPPASRWRRPPQRASLCPATPPPRPPR